MIEQLYDAAPYIGRFQDSIFVIKIGGEILLSQERLTSLARQLHVLWQIGVHPIVIHGAGPQLDAALKEQGYEARKVEGRRVTDHRVLEAAKRTFRGTVNLDLVTSFGGAGLPCVGISGVDAGLLVLRKRPPVEMNGVTVDFGLVGDPARVEPRLLRTLIGDRLVPVVCSLGIDAEGQVLNVNADTVACELAVALDAAKLLFVTDRPGVLHDVDDPSTIYSVLDLPQIDDLVSNGTIRGGMAPKISSATSALRRGVDRVHIIGADEQDSLLNEVFTNQGCGTMIVAKKRDSQ
jgi:acetylglutamate kinase